MSAAFHCPGCFTTQALYPNVVAPGPDLSVYVTCPDCEALAVHNGAAHEVEALREWARRVVHTDVENVCRAVAREASR